MMVTAPLVSRQVQDHDATRPCIVVFEVIAGFVFSYFFFGVHFPMYVSVIRRFSRAMVGDEIVST
jgi:hypothetical protein